MFEGKSILAIITARGTSKGVPRKNMRSVGGKPLIAWTIEEAQESKYIDRLILSSEDAEIIETARSFKCEVPFARPVELAGDKVPATDVVIHILKTLPEHYDYVVLLQPTSPMRLAEDIGGCIKLCIEARSPACVSVTEADKPPHWMYEIRKDKTMSPILPIKNLPSQRQDLPTTYILNGAVYVAKTDWLLEKKTFMTEETIAYQMPREHSLDIDTEMDIQICEMLLRMKQ